MQRTLELGPGDLLLGVTDGLVERRGWDLDEGLDEVLRLVGQGGGSLDDLVERVAITMLRPTPGAATTPPCWPSASSPEARCDAPDLRESGTPCHNAVLRRHGPPRSEVECTAARHPTSCPGCCTPGARREVVRVGHGSPDRQPQ